MEQDILHRACRLWKPERALSALPATYYWKDILHAAVNMRLTDDRRQLKHQDLASDGMQLTPFCGAVFTGCQGNGRHSTAEALAGSLKLAPGTSPEDVPIHIRIYGADLDYEAPDPAVAAINSLSKAMAQAKGLCLLLDDPQYCRHSRMIQTRLLQLMEETAKPLFIIIVTDKPDSVLPALYRKLLCCHCDAPTLAERKRYLKSQYQWVLPKSEGSPKREPTPLTLADMNLPDLAEETEGFSWSQMDQLMRHIRFHLYRNAMNQCKEDMEKEMRQARTDVERDTAKKLAQKQAPRKRMVLIQENKVDLHYYEVEPMIRLMGQQNMMVQPTVMQVAAGTVLQKAEEASLDITTLVASVQDSAEPAVKEASPQPAETTEPEPEPLPFGDTEELKKARDRKIDENDLGGLLAGLNITVDLSDMMPQDTE